MDRKYRDNIKKNIPESAELSAQGSVNGFDEKDRVRAVWAFTSNLSDPLYSPSLFMPSEKGYVALDEIFKAYFQCRQNKRKTINALKFEMNYEENLVQLWNDINNETYQIGRSIAFIVKKPVLREVFAADFRDRIVHHYIIMKINPLFENLFIEDSYSCRVGKGTLFGVNRIASFMRQCSPKAYVFKLDIEGFFMHIDKAILMRKLIFFLQENYFEEDKNVIIRLCRLIIENDPTRDCIIKGSVQDWKNLPKQKSLFGVGHDKGLPIGNLTSQIFGNFYLHDLDMYITRTLGFRYYGRYVDDMILIDEDLEKLKRAITQINLFLKCKLKLNLHPRKIYLQPIEHGVKYIGAVIKPDRIYIANRTKGNCWQSVAKHNSVVRDHKPNRDEIQAFQSSVNSYFGFMIHYRSYHIRMKVIKKDFSAYWWNHIYMKKGYVTIKNRIVTGSALQCEFHRSKNYWYGKNKNQGKSKINNNK